MKKIVYKFIEGCPVISIVDSPAVESEYITFSKVEHFEFNEEKQIVTGIALRADFEIPREGYSIVFPPQEIEKLAHATMLEGFVTTFNHTKEVAETAIVESYILRQPDERFPDVAPGSWLISLKALTPDTWKRIKQLKGFSVEVLVDVPKTQFSHMCGLTSWLF